MNTVDRIVKLCQERGISIAKLERECDFANGYLKKLKKDVPHDRLQIIAAYLGVPVSYFVGDVQPNVQADGYYVIGESAEIAQAVFEDPDLRILFKAARDVSPENIRLAAEMLRRMKETNPDG